MQHYQYAPLDRESDTIRLLRLLPSEVDKAEIRVELLEYDLRHSQQSLHSYEAFSYFLRHSQQSRHSYEALSYVWGGLETTQSILIGDEELRITSNLHAALLRLRDVTFPRILWVDAVCINQSDDPEKELQIQSMAMIYGFAKRTIVWLGEETEGSDIALEAIRFAGNKRDSIFNDNNGSSGRAGADEGYVRNAIASLLQREWFERIWVLQEVAAARHIVVVCGPTEIDGYALCLGLEQMGSTGDNATSYARARPVLALIQGAIFRSQIRSWESDMVALDICSLEELISMYSAHRTTHSHDKIYALLGMSTDDITRSGLLPDYSVPWEELMRRLLTFILGKEICIKSGTHREEVEITGRRCIIGSVSSITRNSNGSQRINVNWNDRMVDAIYPNDHYMAVRATVNDVQVYDIVYLLQEASRPLIIRPDGLFFRIVTLAVTPPIAIRKGIFPHCLHLTWSWMRYRETPRKDHWFSYYMNESRSYWTAAMILQLTGKAASASLFLQKLMELQIMPFSEREKTLASSGELPSGFSEPTQVELAEIVQSLDASHIMFFFKSIGHTVSVTEEVLIALVQHHRSHVVFSVLKAVRNRNNITARVLKAATRNVNTTVSYVTEALLEWRKEEPQDLLTEAVLIAAFLKPGALRSAILETLLNLFQDLPKDPITEAVLIAVAQNQEAVGGGVLSTLPNWSDELPSKLISNRERIPIAEMRNLATVLSDEPEALPYLFKLPPDIQVTDAVLIAVIQDKEVIERGILRKLLRWPDKDINDLDENTVPYTVALLAAFATNPRAANKNIMEALLSRSTNHSRTFVKLIEAAETEHTILELFTILWDSHYELAATESVLAATVNNCFSRGQHLFCALVHSRGDQGKCERLMIVCCSNFNQFNLNTLIETILFIRYQGHIPATIWAAAAANPKFGDEYVSILVRNTLRSRKECCITEDILVAAASNGHRGYTVLRSLLPSNNKAIKFPDGVATPPVLKAAASNLSDGLAVMQLLLEHKENKAIITVHADMMLAAALQGNASLLRYLLSIDKRKVHMPDVVSTSEILEAVAKNDRWDKRTRDEIKRSLLKYDGKQDITHEAEEGTLSGTKKKQTRFASFLRANSPW
ncbi:hypothetical protein HBI83_022120 [Parastagonospora nodorum]|nr:hypothetical protein HBI83_022120 [Parastagonospora nodorum]